MGGVRQRLLLRTRGRRYDCFHSACWLGRLLPPRTRVRLVDNNRPVYRHWSQTGTAGQFNWLQGAARFSGSISADGQTLEGSITRWRSRPVGKCPNSPADPPCGYNRTKDVKLTLLGRQHSRHGRQERLSPSLSDHRQDASRLLPGAVLCSHTHRQLLVPLGDCCLDHAILGAARELPLLNQLQHARGQARHGEHIVPAAGQDPGPTGRPGATF